MTSRRRVRHAFAPDRWDDLAIFVSARSPSGHKLLTALTEVGPGRWAAVTEPLWAKASAPLSREAMEAQLANLCHALSQVGDPSAYDPRQ